jgi:hypothetical protein
MYDWNYFQFWTSKMLSVLFSLYRVYIRDLCGGINDFKSGHQPGTNVVKDGKGDLVADSHSILARWRNHFS